MFFKQKQINPSWRVILCPAVSHVVLEIMVLGLIKDSPNGYFPRVALSLCNPKSDCVFK